MSDILIPDVYTLGHDTGLLSVQFDRKGDGGVIEFLTGEKAAAEDKRRELIERSMNGEHIELMVTALTYQQHDDRPDANYTDFSTSALAALKKSAPNTPLLQDHKKHDTNATIGYSLAARLEKTEDGTRQLVEDLAVVKPFAVQSVLDGTMRFFSIGARPVGPIHEVIQCRVCQDSVTKCGHLPGEVVETRKGSQTVIWRYTDARMLERSWVNDPAVSNTKIQGYIEKARQGKQDFIMNETKTHDLEFEALQAQVTDLTNSVNAKVSELEAVTSERDALRAELDAIKHDTEKMTLEGRVTELLKTGHLAPNGAQEKQIRDRIACNDFSAATALVEFAASAQPVTPAGTPRQSSTTTETTGKPDWLALFSVLPEHIRDMAGDHAKNPEHFLKSNRATCAKYGIVIPENF